MKRIVENKHHFITRWTHWVNFPVLGIMIWSGLLIYWANSIYHIGSLITFFPDSFFKKLNIPRRLAEGMSFHFFFMWFFMLNGIVYVLYTIVTKQWRLLLPNSKSWKEAWLVLLHDLHLRKTAPEQGKYNAAQRVAYSMIIIMGIFSTLTGLAIYKPVQLNWLCWAMGGYEFSRLLHFALTIGYVLFFIIHIVQVIIAGWNNFRSMVVGFDVVEDGNA